MKAELYNNNFISNFSYIWIAWKILMYTCAALWLFPIFFFLSLYWIYYSIVFAVFMFCFFGHEACGILVLQTGIEPASSALKCKVLITGLQKKSLPNFFESSYQYLKWLCVKVEKEMAMHSSILV